MGSEESFLLTPDLANLQDSTSNRGQMKAFI